MTALVDARRMIGTVLSVSGTTMWCSLVDAAAPARTVLGERVQNGEVGQFVVVDADGSRLLGRVVEVRAHRADLLRRQERGDGVPADARVQLLGTLAANGRADRGVERYPLIGADVYAARAASVRDAVAADSSTSVRIGSFGTEGLPVDVPVQALFARHLAVLGSTGGGKSWTVARLAEAVAELGGRMVLLDPTGEYASLASGVRHLIVGDDRTAGTPADVPHHHMRDIDRIAFFSPSSGVQLPRMRAAIRRLRLAHAAATHETHKSVVSDDGCLRVASTTLVTVDAAFPGVADAEHAPFDLSNLANQLEIDVSTEASARSVVGPLLTRIRDVLQTDDIMRVIGGGNGADLVAEMMHWLDDGDEPILRVSLADIPATHDLREIVVNVIGNQLLQRARSGAFRDAPLLLAVDEAHQFIGGAIGDEDISAQLDAFERIAKEGRKYGLNLCIATQRPSDLPAGLLSQLGMMIVHRLADGRDRALVQEAAAETDLDALRFLPGLQQGEAIVMGVDLPLPMTVRIQRPTNPPNSVGPDYASTWPRRRSATAVMFEPPRAEDGRATG
ncbi:ATP-binding protein [Curtobacterium sp. RHCJP20]|uniref:ATP-binding protein n=1 Tax=Curtobacterium subtropicum TaxID=3055138 RepID=A0ABT7TDP5_9MICO|nr:ATP-binding protein [Curtobacterium subtropicum]MDM7887685.1 ATP-binding protein [Curtobacterium subtropicum]